MTDRALCTCAQLENKSPGLHIAPISVINVSKDDSNMISNSIINIIGVNCPAIVREILHFGLPYST